MSARSVAGGCLADEMRALAERVKAEKNAEWERRKARDRAALERYLRKSARGRTRGMYAHCMELIREASGDGRRSVFQAWPDDPTTRSSVEAVAKRLRAKKNGFRVEWKQDIDTGRDGFGERPVVTMTTDW